MSERGPFVAVRRRRRRRRRRPLLPPLRNSLQPVVREEPGGTREGAGVPSARSTRLLMDRQDIGAKRRTSILPYDAKYARVRLD